MWWYVYPCGCTVLTFDAVGEGALSVDDDVATAVSFFDRGPVSAPVESDLGIDD